MDGKGTDMRSIRRASYCCLIVGLLNSVVAGQTARSFLSRDGEQAAQPSTGNTTLQMTSGDTETIMVFLEDLVVDGSQLNAYQVLLPTVPEPLAGATGTINYIDNDPGGGGGDTVVIDTLRDDWVFADEVVTLDPTYNETPASGFMGVFYATIPGLGPVTDDFDISYILQADFIASADACGDFEMRIRIGPKAPPLSAYFTPSGTSFGDVEYQTLIITVDGPACGGGCEDPCSDDDVCTVKDACDGEVCVGQPVDCSGDGDECNEASCDAAGNEGNCDTLTPVADGTPCGINGMCTAGECIEEPGCEDPCSDGDACTINDACDGDVCVGEAVDCSGQGDECNDASCDDGGNEGNCDTLTPVADGTPCGDEGMCVAGVCDEGGGGDNMVRVFMAKDGEQGAQPNSGATAIQMMEGTTQKVTAFFEDLTQDKDILEGHQLLFPYTAEKLNGAVGTVTYVDIDPGIGGGNSIVIDTLRDDWLFAESIVATMPVYNETPNDGFFGVFYATVPGLGIPPGGTGIRYVLEFDIVASEDAQGQFLIKFRLAPKSPPLSAFFAPGGTEFLVDEYQDLIVTVGEVVEPMCPAGAVTFVDPPSGVVDARQPHPTDDPNDLLGIDTLVVEAPEGAAESCWSLCENGTGGLGDNAIDSVVADGTTYTISLVRPITAGELTTVIYTDDTMADTVGSFVSHPANVNADNVSAPLDIIELVDILNGVADPAFGDFSSDIDHSGTTAPLDILALIDLLNGADAQEVWNNYEVPAGPCDP